MSRRMKKATKKLIRQFMPKGKYCEVVFDCPVCGKEHIKRIEMLFEWRFTDGYAFTTYTQTMSSAICYECVMALDKDPTISAKYRAVVKKYNEDYTNAQHGRLSFRSA